MNEPLSTLEERVSRLEKAAQPRGVRHFITSNWAILSFLAAVAVATYVKFSYGIDYLEQYRNTATLKQMSRYYSRMGARLVESQEWEAADVAYKRALELNPHNLDAQFGRLKAEVFDPLPGRQYVAPEIAEARLKYLEELFPHDDDVQFLHAVADAGRGATSDAEKRLKAILHKRPDFAAGHQTLGFLYQNAFRIDDAIASYKRAVELNPAVASASNNLGYCYLLKTQFTRAVHHLSRALESSAYAVTGLNLGDAYRYAGDINAAYRMHDIVYTTIIRSSNVNERERYIEGTWTYNFMPLHRKDRETIKQYVIAGTLEQKRAITRMAMAIDLGLLGRYSEADQELTAALQLDNSADYRQFYANRLLAADRLLSLPAGTKVWLQTRAFAVTR
jgi:tetratricopeptide (TPR) repeat protein